MEQKQAEVFLSYFHKFVITFALEKKDISWINLALCRHIRLDGHGHWRWLSAAGVVVAQGAGGTCPRDVSKWLRGGEDRARAQHARWSP